MFPVFYMIFLVSQIWYVLAGENVSLGVKGDANTCSIYRLLNYHAYNSKSTVWTPWLRNKYELCQLPLLCILGKNAFYATDKQKKILALVYKLFNILHIY